MNPLSKTILFSNPCSLVLYAFFILSNVILTVKISLHSIYDLLWHEDNFSIFLYFVRFFSIKWIVQSLLFHLDRKLIPSPPQTYLYMLDLYSLFNILFVFLFLFIFY